MNHNEYHTDERRDPNGGASSGTRPRQLGRGHLLCGVDLWPGLGMERFLSPPVPWRPAHAIHYAHRYGRAARRCDDPADHAYPHDRSPHHAPLRQQGWSERLPWPLALPEILSGGTSHTGRLRHGGGSYRAGTRLGRVQVVGGKLVRLSHAPGHCAASHSVYFWGVWHLPLLLAGLNYPGVNFLWAIIVYTFVSVARPFTDHRLPGASSGRV